MFRKRIKKTYPPGTFIAAPARVAAILQLCLAFTIFLWHASQPFMGDLFAIRSKMAVYEYVLGIKNPSQRIFFEQLLEQKQETIAADYASLQHQLQRPIMTKVASSLHAVFVGIPPFELAWLMLSIIVSILLLKKVDGAIQAAWLLPLLAAAYALDNRLNGLPQRPNAEMLLFPSEETLITQYLDEPFSKNIFKQQEQLKQSWERYLIAQWSGSSHQLEQGEYAFNVARLDALKSEQKGQHQESLLVLACYLFWNVSFALLTKTAANQIHGHTGKIADESCQ